MGKCFFMTMLLVSTHGPDQNSCHRNLSVLVKSGAPVTADFTGGQITSDAGLALVAQLDRHYRITKRFAKCFEDHRDPKRCNTL